MVEEWSMSRLVPGNLPCSFQCLTSWLFCSLQFSLCFMLYPGSFFIVWEHGIIINLALA